MKKILALVLACVMLASMFTVNAFAAPTTIVGSGDSSNRGGVASANGSTNNNVSVAVQEVTSKYYVDIDYTTPAYELPGITWNVKTLQYDLTDDTYDADVTGKFGENTVLTITNYSDVKVNVAIAITEAVAGATDYITVTGPTSGEVAGYDHTGLVYGDDTKVGSTTFELDVNCTNPVLAAKYYQNATTSVVVATYTVTIS